MDGNALWDILNDLRLRKQRGKMFKPISLFVYIARLPIKVRKRQ